MTNLNVAIIPVTPFQQNCAVLFDSETKRGSIIDPGGDVPRILEALKEMDVTLDQIVLTHGHIDHAGGAAELAETLGLEIIGPHPDDTFLLEGIAAQGRMYGVTGVRDCAPDRFLREGESIDMAGLTFEVLECPGHTPGHIVFINRDIKLAIVGDVLFRGSVGRTDFPRSSHDALMNSIRTKLMVLDDDVTFLCGHGPASTIGEERASNPFVHEALAGSSKG